MQNVNTMKLSRITIGVRTVVSYFDYTERWSDPSWTMIILYMAQLEHHNKSTGSYTQSGFAALLGAFRTSPWSVYVEANEASLLEDENSYQFSTH